MELNFGKVDGLPPEEQKQLEKLRKIWNFHRSKNRKKRRYYNGNLSLAEVNLGIALPTGIAKLKIGCDWGAKSVDVLASRSMLDGYVDSDGESAEIMTEIIRRNKLLAEYKKATKDELLYGCIFAAVSGERGNAVIRFYNEHNAAAAWDDHEGRAECGFAFEDNKYDESDMEWSPKHVTFYTATATWMLDNTKGHWVATEYKHDFGMPMLIPMAYCPSKDKPFGKSRIKHTIRTLMQGYVRTIANATIGLEFSTAPQKYMLGVSDRQYDDMIDDKFKQYVGSMLLATNNPETGEKPTYGQLPQGTIQPHVEMMRILATQFSAASGLSVTDTGVVNDANPTSSEAILAQTQTLVKMAEELNESNGDALYTIAQMAIAVELGTTPAELPDDVKDIVPHFKNPAMPSVSVSADAAVKIASSRESFAQTDVFLEMLGFDCAEIRRIKAQEQRAMGAAILAGEFV